MRFRPLLTTLTLLTVLLGAQRLHAQASVVAEAKSDLQARGVDLSGACGALKITNLVAYRLSPRFGLLHKAGGNRAILQVDGSCLTGEQSNDPEGYATDYLIDRATGFGYDLLTDGGGNNGPQWAGPENAPDMVSRNWNNYREPVDPAGYLAGGPTGPNTGGNTGNPGQPPVVPSNPPPVIVLPSTDLSPVLNQQAIDHALLLNIQAQVEASRREVADFREAVRSKWGLVTKFAAKYILPAVAGLVGGWKMK